jgi:4'-phosphopantetheinyl transferase
VNSHRAILYYSALDHPADAGAAAALGALEAQLPYARRTAPRREGHLASLLGVALALRALGALLGRSVAPVELSFPPGGKPQLPGGPDFSVSHAAHWVAAVAVRTGRIGLDIEPGAADALTLARVCDEQEREAVRAHGAAAMWVAKEAALKALGLSVREAASIRIRGPRAARGACRLHLRSLDLFAGARACLASSEPSSSLAFEAHELPLAGLTGEAFAAHALR